jgi:hypothetical protein
MGALIGLVYGLVFNNINILLIRDIPLQYSLSKSLADTIIATLLLGALGYIVNWPETAFTGVTIPSVFGALALAIGTLSKTDGSAGSVISVLFVQMYTFLPTIVLFLPLNLLLRWSASQFYHNAHEPLLGRHKVRALVVILGAAILVGSFTMYSQGARNLMRKTNAYILAIQKDGVSANVPPAIKELTDVIQRSGPAYTLDWSDDLRKFPAALVFEDAFMMERLEVVLIYFDNGEQAACLFRATDRSLYLCSKGP